MACGPFSRPICCDSSSRDWWFPGRNSPEFLQKVSKVKHIAPACCQQALKPTLLHTVLPPPPTRTNPETRNIFKCIYMYIIIDIPRCSAAPWAASGTSASRAGGSCFIILLIKITPRPPRRCCRRRRKKKSRALSPCAPLARDPRVMIGWPLPLGLGLDGALATGIFWGGLLRKTHTQAIEYPGI